MRNLVDFLVDLATNPKQQETFAERPNEAMTAFELSETDQAKLKTGNRAQISAILADESFQPAFAIGDPNPDPWPDPDPPSPSPEPSPPDDENL